LAWSGSEYGVAWQALDGSGDRQVFFTRVSTGGEEAGGETAVTATSTPSRQPRLVWNGNGYAVAYNEGLGSSRLILLTRIDASGNAIGGPTQVSDAATGGSQIPGLTWNGGEYGLIWHDLRHGNGEVYFARVAASGVEIGSERRLTDSPSDSVARGLVWNGAEYALVWSEAPQIRFLRLGCNCVDGDGDGASSCNDNCVGLFNPSQSDFDSDFEGDHCDLDDGMIYIRLAQKTEVDWQLEQGYDSWNFYKGDLDLLPLYTQVPGSNPLADRECGLPAPPAADGDPPAAGKTAFFLVAGVSTGFEGGLGTDSSGTPRINANPCP
jgi:hypothetical protein